MPYIGNTIRAADDYRLIDDISSGFNGSETSFALQVAGSAPVPFPKSPQQVLISVNGVIQEPDPTGSSGFNLVGTNIVFSSAPTNGHAFFGIIYATADYLNAGGNFPAGSLGAPSITFIGDENTGLFRKSGGSVGFVSDATEIANFDSNGITISSGNIIIPDSIIHNGDTDTKIRFPSANTVSVETAGTEKLKILHDEIIINETGGDFDLRIEGDAATNLVKIDAGNDKVGINNSAPEEKLHVGGAIVTTGSNNTASTAGSNRAILDFTSGGARVGHFRGTTSAGSGSVKFFVDSSEKMQIDASGNVGIGTASANELLHISGNSSGAISAKIENTYSSDATRFAILELKSGVGSIRFHDQGDTLEGEIKYDSTSNSMRFHTNGNSERMRINSSGNVVIGATNAPTKLSVRGTSASTDSTVQIVGIGTSTLLLGQDSDGGVIRGQGGNNALKFKVGGGGDAAAAAGGTDALFINSSGKVGIGTTSPTRVFEINNSQPCIRLTNGTNAYDIGTGGFVDGSDSLCIHDQGQGERLRLDSSGRFLIGTGAAATPKATSHGVDISANNMSIVFGADSNSGNDTQARTNNTMKDQRIGAVHYTNSEKPVGVVRVLNQTSANDIFFGGGSSLFNAATSLRFFTGADNTTQNGTEAMRINSIGNVGIGTTNPGQRLEVRQTSASHAIIAVNRPNSDTFCCALGNNSNNNAVISSNNTDLIFGRDLAGTFSERFRMTNDGRVSFGNSSPPSGVNGAITFVGFTSRNGTNGSNTSNLHNFQWTGSALNAFVDTTNMGEIRNSASDYRIKRNIQTQTESGIDKIKQLRCVTYSPADYTGEGGTSWSVASDEIKEGFIAHEVAAIIPSGVSGTKDDPNRIQQLNIDAIVSVLTKALQEEVVKREALEARIAALEAA